MPCDPTEARVEAYVREWIDANTDDSEYAAEAKDALLGLVRQEREDAHKEAFAAGWEAADQTQGLRYVLTFNRCWQRYCLEHGLAAPQRAEERSEFCRSPHPSRSMGGDNTGAHAVLCQLPHGHEGDHLWEGQREDLRWPQRAEGAS